MRLVLKEKSNISGNITSFRFTHQNGFKFKAGQYLRYELEHKDPDDRGIYRFFTISSAPFEKDITLTTRILSEGGSTFKKKLGIMVAGESIYAYGPSGDFIVEDPKRPMLFIAGGIGITPFRSIILDLDNRDELYDIRLLYCTSDNIIPFKDEFGRIAEKKKGFSIDYVRYPKKCDFDLVALKADDLFKRQVYLSGPIGLIQSLEKDLRQNGVSEKNIKLDYFPGY